VAPAARGGSQTKRTGLSTLYNGAGTKEALIVTIPPADPNNKNTPTGTPTGTIFNAVKRISYLLLRNQRYSSFPRMTGRLLGGIQL